MNCPHDGAVLVVTRRSASRSTPARSAGAWLDCGELDKVIAHACTRSRPGRPPSLPPPQARKSAREDMDTPPVGQSKETAPPGLELVGGPVQGRPATHRPEDLTGSTLTRRNGPLEPGVTCPSQWECTGALFDRNDGLTPTILNTVPAPRKPWAANLALRAAERLNGQEHEFCTRLKARSSGVF